MSVFSQYKIWATGQTIVAADLNGEIATIVAAGNNVDSANIGPNGLYASQIKPISGATATFGGAQNYTFPQDVILAASAATTPGGVALWNDNAGTNGLVLNVPTGSTNGFQFMVNAAAVASLSNAGKASIFGATSSAEIDLTGNTVTAGQVAIGGDNGGTKGMLLNVPTGSTNGFRFQVNGATLAQLSATGDLQVGPLISALNTLTRVAPVYTASGGQVASTLHMVTGALTLTSNGSTPAFSTISWTTSNTLTLTNSAVFSSASSYIVLVTPAIEIGQIVPFIAGGQTATSFTIQGYNANSGSLAGGNSVTFNWLAIGT